MAEQLYGVTMEESGSTRLVAVAHTRNEAEDWMERLEEERYEQRLANGDLAGGDHQYEPVYRVEEFDPEVLGED